MIWVGKRETMDAKRIMEIPFPMPNSVICSPIHMTSALPAVKVRMITIACQTPVSLSRGWEPMELLRSSM